MQPTDDALGTRVAEHLASRWQALNCGMPATGQLEGASFVDTSSPDAMIVLGGSSVETWHLAVAVEHLTDGALSAHSEELPACWSCGDMEAEALENIHGAISVAVECV